MKHHFLILALLISTTEAMPQRLVDKREQAEGWYLPVHGQAFIDGKKTDGYLVRLYEENEYKGEVPVDKKGRFLLELDIDKTYTVELTRRLSASSCSSTRSSLKLVEHPDYECYVNLTPEEAHQGKQDFYTDFPTAIIRVERGNGRVLPQQHYLEHPEQAATWPRRASDRLQPAKAKGGRRDRPSSFRGRLSMLVVVHDHLRATGCVWQVSTQPSPPHHRSGA